MEGSRTARLSSAERRLVAPAAGLLLFFQMTLWFLPFSRVRALALSMARGRASRARAPEEIGRVVEGLVRRIPMLDCLPQSLTAFVLLSRSGHAATVRVGVARDERFAAHAWVECHGVAVVGGAEKAAFTQATGADLLRT